MKKLTTDQKIALKNIVELVEDKDFPARRSILDYVEALFDYSPEVKAFIAEELRRYPQNHG